MSDVKYPTIRVKLTGTDGNVFALSGKIGKALRKPAFRTMISRHSTGASTPADPMTKRCR